MKRKVVTREHNTTVRRRPNKTVTRSETKTISRHHGRVGAPVMRGLSALTLTAYRTWQQLKTMKPVKPKKLRS